jgi:hypothetical protein
LTDLRVALRGVAGDLQAEDVGEELRQLLVLLGGVRDQAEVVEVQAHETTLLDW